MWKFFVALCLGLIVYALFSEPLGLAFDVVCHAAAPYIGTAGLLLLFALLYIIHGALYAVPPYDAGDGEEK